MVAAWPASSVPMLHGKAVTHAPLVATKVSPAGVESCTTTPVAAFGPWFVTTRV
jgi:hypothetical protein